MSEMAELIDGLPHLSGSEERIAAAILAGGPDLRTAGVIGHLD